MDRWLCRARCFGSTRVYSEYKDKPWHKTHPLNSSQPKDPEQWSLKSSEASNVDSAILCSLYRSSLSPLIPRTATLLEEKKKYLTGINFFCERKIMKQGKQFPFTGCAGSEFHPSAKLSLCRTLSTPHLQVLVY